MKAAWLAIFGVVTCLLSSVTLAQSSLPKEVQADVLRQQLTAAYEADDHKEFLDLILEYKRLVGWESVPVPLLFAEARSSVATQDYLRALAALQDYLQKADKTGPQYPAAIRLYPTVHEAANRQSDGLVELIEKIAGVYYHNSDGCGVAGQEIDGYLDIKEQTWRMGKAGFSFVSLRVQSLVHRYPQDTPVDYCSMRVEFNPAEPERLMLRVGDRQNQGSWCKIPNVAELNVGDLELRLKGDFFSRETCPSGNQSLTFYRYGQGSR